MLTTLTGTVLKFFTTASSLIPQKNSMREDTKKYPHLPDEETEARKVNWLPQDAIAGQSWDSNPGLLAPEFKSLAIT